MGPIGIHHIRQFNPLGHFLLRTISAERSLSGTDVSIRAEKLVKAAMARAARTPAYQMKAHELSRLSSPRALSIRTTKEMLKDQPKLFRPLGFNRILPTAIGVTSGSTGTPLTVRRSIHDVSFEQSFFQWWQLQHGFSPKMRAAVLRGNLPQAFVSGEIALHLSTRQILLNSFRLNQENFRLYLKILREHQTEVLYCYPSTGLELSRLMIAFKESPPKSLKLVITSSECLSIENRLILTETLNAKVVDWYGSAERVLAAGQCSNQRYHFFWNYGAVDVDLDGQMIGSSLRWNALQLLNYETGDVIDDLTAEECGCGWPDLHAGAIEGRVGDFVVGGDGTRVSRLDKVLTDVPDLIMGQIVQELDGTLQVRLVLAEGKLLTQRTISSITNRVTARVPGRPVSIALVDSIPREPSGKFKEVIRHFNL